MPTPELTNQQIRQLVLRPRSELIHGRSLGNYLQDAVAMDNVTLLERFRDICQEVYEEEMAAAASGRDLKSLQDR